MVPEDTTYHDTEKKNTEQTLNTTNSTKTEIVPTIGNTDPHPKI